MSQVVFSASVILEFFLYLKTHLHGQYLQQKPKATKDKNFICDTFVVYMYINKIVWFTSIVLL